jgi:predicted RNA binding protein YcfA (HicA-like mRNA interferase family)
MGHKRNLESCHSGDDFISYSARQSGVKIKYGGRHPKVVGPHGGICPIPAHGNGDLPEGTRRSIIRMLRLIGIVVLILIILIGILVLF